MYPVAEFPTILSYLKMFTQACVISWFMDSLGHAYRIAVEMLQSFGDEAANVASERAESCRRKGDEKEAGLWDRVTAFSVHITRQPTMH